MKKLLLVTVETVAATEHKFFFNGSIQELDGIISNEFIHCCDKYGKPTNISKGFHPDNMTAITIVEVDAEIAPVENLDNNIK